MSNTRKACPDSSIVPNPTELNPTELSEKRSASTVVTCPSCDEPRLTLNDSCGVCGWLLPKRKRNCNKKPASGSLNRLVSVKKGKEYSTWQYSYSIRDPETKKGWRTVKEGVPKHKSHLVADGILEGRPIREILDLLGKELMGEVNE